MQYVATAEAVDEDPPPGGLIVEHAAVEDLYASPKHPYTHALLQTLPSLDSERAEKLQSISGQPPSLDAEPTTCPFAPRCEFAFERCFRENPAIRSTNGGWAEDRVSHDVACWWDIEKGAPRDDG